MYLSRKIYSWKLALTKITRLIYSYVKWKIWQASQFNFDLITLRDLQFSLSKITVFNAS